MSNYFGFTFKELHYLNELFFIIISGQLCHPYSFYCISPKYYIHFYHFFMSEELHLSNFIYKLNSNCMIW